MRNHTRGGRLVAAALAVAGVAASLLAGAPVASAHPGQPSAVFDPDEAGWAGLRDRTMVEFDADLKAWGDKDFLPVDLEVDTFGGATQPTFGGAFQYNTDKRTWLVDTVMTKAEYDAKFDDAKKRGLRPVDREMYLWKGQWYFAAAWVQNVEGLYWEAKYGLTLAQLNTFVEDKRHQGMMPIDFDMYRTPQGVRYGVIFLDNPENLDWHLHGDLTNVGFSTTFDAYEPTFRMLSFDSAPDGGSQLYGGIWVENANDRGWRMRRSMTQHTYGNHWHRDSDEGYRQIFVGRYETGGGVQYAAIWRQNSDRPTWRYRHDVENHVAARMAVDDLPGVAVAVLQGGEFTFVRGFGQADIDGDVLMDSGHVLRWASVSKAVGGALVMRLDEQGVLDRDETAKHYFPGLAAQHTATLEQLVSNRGCVRHYANNKTSTLEDVDAEQWETEKDQDDQLATTWYADAATAVEVFDDDPLRSYDKATDTVSTTCTPGDSNLYSTHGLTVAAAGAEGATGTGIKDLVRTEISEPLGLETLRQEELSDTAVRRAKLYKDADNEEAEPDQITWKTLGGGLESDIRDMARFGRAVAQGDAYTDTEYVWNGGAEGWSYAYGWGMDTRDGHRVAEKNGGQLGSDAHLLVYPDDDTVVAVMTNREELSDPADHATEIARYIGDLIL